MGHPRGFQSSKKRRFAQATPEHFNLLARLKKGFQSSKHTFQSSKHISICLYYSLEVGKLGGKEVGEKRKLGSCCWKWKLGKKEVGKLGKKRN